MDRPAAPDPLPANDGGAAGPAPAGDAAYAAGELGVDPDAPQPDRAAPVEVAASKPAAAPDAIELPAPPGIPDRPVNPRPGSGG
jgi:hypothetical protein